MDGIRFKEAIKALSAAMLYLSVSEKEKIKPIIENYELRLSKYEWSNLDVISATNFEIGNVRSTIKRNARFKYIEGYCHREGITRNHNRKIVNELGIICDKTRFSERLISARILVSRRNPSGYRIDPLDKVLKEVIMTEFLRELYEKNKSFFDNHKTFNL